MKKHIYIFTTQARGSYYGIGTYVKQLISVLRKTEYGVTLVDLIYKDVEFEVLEKNSIRYICIPAPIINKQGLSVNAFHESVPFVLYPYINQEEHNIFHFNYMESGNIAKCLRLLVGGTIVLTVHYTDWSFSLLGKRRKLLQIQRKRYEHLDLGCRTIIEYLEREKEFLNICDKVVVISRHSFRDLVKIHQVDEKKLVFISNALSSPKTLKKNSIRIREKYHILSTEMVIVFVGRLDVVKGIDILIGAFKQVVDRYPCARLFIVGDGNFSKCLSDSFGVCTRVTFTGFLSRKKLFELYNIADIGVIPSLHEEFGYVAIEMMSQKVPIIVNDTTGLSEIVDDTINGFKVALNANRSTWRRLIDKICFLIENPDIREQIGENAYDKFKTYYSVKSYRKKMIDFYASV